MRPQQAVGVQGNAETGGGAQEQGEEQPSILVVAEEKGFLHRTGGDMEVAVGELRAEYARHPPTVGLTPPSASSPRAFFSTSDTPTRATTGV